VCDVHVHAYLCVRCVRVCAYVGVHMSVCMRVFACMHLQVSVVRAACTSLLCRGRGGEPLCGCEAGQVYRTGETGRQVYRDRWTGPFLCTARVLLIKQAGVCAPPRCTCLEVCLCACNLMCACAPATFSPHASLVSQPIFTGVLVRKQSLWCI